MSSQNANLVIIVFGGFFFLLGLVVAGRMWLMGCRWQVPDAHAKAAEIEGVASLRLGISSLLAGGCIAGGGAFLAWMPESARNGFAGGFLLVLLVEAIVAAVWVFRSAERLSSRAVGVRIQEKLPKRPTLYQIWPPRPPENDNANPN